MIAFLYQRSLIIHLAAFMEVRPDRYQKRSPQGYDETRILVDQDKESLARPLAIAIQFKECPDRFLV